MTKPKINFWWAQQPFRLDLKGYQGNCVTCYKKGHHKLYQIAKENPAAFNFFGIMELKYSKYIPESRLKLMAERDELPKFPIHFFRGNKSAEDILNESKSWNGSVNDDTQINDSSDFDNYDLVGGETCEVFAECGDN